MRSWVARAGITGLLVAAGLAFAQDAPKSILPPGFDEPVSPKRVEPQPEPVTEVKAADPSATATAPPVTAAALPAGPDAMASVAPRADPNAVGLLSPAAGGYGPATFAASNGRLLTGLMNRLDAPIASRWAHILLRRALLSQVATPTGLRPADWVADRAWLLVRLGEADGAKALVEAVPVDRYTVRMYAVAAQVSLASSDLPALCPLTSTARSVSKEPFWPMMDAVCAGMNGDDLTAASIFDGLRAREAADPFDLKLAERVTAAVNGGGRAANIEWQDVNRLSIFRFGLAVAGGVMPSAELLAKAPPQVRAWLFRVPTAPVDTRVAMAASAAALGVASSDEMVRTYSALAAELDPVAFEASPASQLRTAFAGRTPNARVAAMRALWNRGTDAQSRYAMKILTARAAAGVRPTVDQVEAAPMLIESMLSAGLIAPARRWWPVLDDAGGTPRDLAWAALAVADDDIPATGRAFDAWYDAEKQRIGDAAATRRARLLAAALAGLARGGGNWTGRLSDLEVAPLDNFWTRQIDAAAAAGRVGEVALLAATGLQTNWAGVPPRHLFHIIAAYKRVGRIHEARMLAVEAVTRG